VEVWGTVELEIVVRTSVEVGVLIDNWGNILTATYPRQ